MGKPELLSCVAMEISMPSAKSADATLPAQGPLPMINVLDVKASPFINFKKDEAYVRKIYRR